MSNSTIILAYIADNINKRLIKLLAYLNKHDALLAYITVITIFLIYCYITFKSH